MLQENENYEDYMEKHFNSEFFFIVLLLPTIRTENQDNFNTKVFNIESSSNQKEMYYQSHGSLKKTYISWDLIAYVDIWQSAT